MNYLIFNSTKTECSASVGRTFDWGSQVCWFEAHLRLSHCVVTLSVVENWFNPGRQEIVLT